MAQLHIAVDPRCDTFEVYQPLLQDEVLSSWVARHRYIKLESDDQDCGERDFGWLTLNLPGACNALQQELHAAAVPPDDWLLRPHQRTLCCARCLADDWSRGVSGYQRRTWCVAWRTCCAKHGRLIDADESVVPTWSSLLSSPCWRGDSISLIWMKLPGHMLTLSLSLNADHRAIHLETALGNGKRNAAWFPQGLTDHALRELYGNL